MASKPMDCVPWVACFYMLRVKADPPSAVGGLEGIEKRVGSWGKKKKERKRKRWRARTSGFTSAAQ
ncbi:MAG: hypothetical protein DWH70_07950 [Planctomycetota bacterium]|nr:MAG: hypothetical protein DWH70_07950 [Planctomycetota bacterium]